MQMHAFAGAAAFLLATLIMPLQTSAALEYSKKICEGVNILDATRNADTPDTLDEAINDSRYMEVFEWQSIWHNFKDGIYPTNPEMLREAKIGAVVEYAVLTGVRLETLKLTHSIDDANKMGLLVGQTFKYLDPNMPNRKFVEKNGHREAVYNKYTGKKVASGINQGTANVALNQFSQEHNEGDVKRWENCIVPSMSEIEIGKMFSENPYLMQEWIHLQENWDVMHEMAKKFGLPVEDFMCMTSEAYKQAEEDRNRAAQKVKDTFSGKEAMSGKSSQQCENPAPAQLTPAIDLTSLDLKDENYDWCKCADPGCVAKSMMGMDYYVSFICTKCGKVNRTYAKRVLEMERKAKEKGIDTIWIGDNAEEKARSAVK